MKAFLNLATLAGCHPELSKVPISPLELGKKAQFDFSNVIFCFSFSNQKLACGNEEANQCTFAKFIEVIGANESWEWHPEKVAKFRGIFGHDFIVLHMVGSNKSLVLFSQLWVQEFGLRPLNVATWGPFVLLNVNRSPLEKIEDSVVGDEWLGGCSQILKRSGVDSSLIYVCRRVYDIECNWKVWTFEFHQLILINGLKYLFWS